MGGTVEGNPIKIHFCNTCEKLGHNFSLETDTEKTDGTIALFHILNLIEVVGEKICLSTNFPFFQVRQDGCEEGGPLGVPMNML